MPRANANGLQLEYDTFGSPTDDPLVLVMGLGAQMTNWSVPFCELLAAQGFHVVRFDNRDIGLSSYLDDLPKTDLQAAFAGDFSTVPYLLADLADDVVGLFDALGFDTAHVVGASMGGMIVQQLAIDHPDRLRSMCSIMSTTGDRTVGQGTPEAMAALMRPPAQSRDEAIETGVAAQQVIGSPGYPANEEEVRAKSAAAYDRAFHPVGMLRQMAAILASPDRTEGLRSLQLPTLVVHGAADPLVAVSGGEATAAAVPDATLLVLPGMGHDIPVALYDTIVEAIATNTKRA
ncbi:MAG TPA: alpha/beta hydrolase [Pseudonocardiaceae bacterium]|jgi:pimeloyl-ACP methyl ester carboxylesterase|nr:alpha/beta hydrolase [Pseudonocardiaceae bacterium]